MKNPKTLTWRLLSVAFSMVLSIPAAASTGMFMARVDYDVSGVPNDIAIHDLNLDGILHLPWRTDDFSSVSTLLGLGDCTFVTVWNYPSSGSASSIAVVPT